MLQKAIGYDTKVFFLKKLYQGLAFVVVQLGVLVVQSWTMSVIVLCSADILGKDCALISYVNPRWVDVLVKKEGLGSRRIQPIFYIILTTDQMSLKTLV